MAKLWLISSLKILKVLVNMGRDQREFKNSGSRCFLLEASEHTADHARDSSGGIIAVAIVWYVSIYCANNQNY